MSFDDALFAIYGYHMSEQTKTTVYLRTRDYRLLKAIARQQERPAAELVREAVAEYTSRKGRRAKPRSLGVGRSGRHDLSERAEELLARMGRRR